MEADLFEATVVAGWLILALLGAAIGARKGAALTSFVLTLLLGPIGILVALISSGNRVSCPACRAKIDPKATVCMHCRTPITGART